MAGTLSACGVNCRRVELPGKRTSQNNAGRYPGILAPEEGDEPSPTTTKWPLLTAGNILLITSRTKRDKCRLTDVRSDVGMGTHLPWYWSIDYTVGPDGSSRRTGFGNDGQHRQARFVNSVSCPLPSWIAVGIMDTAQADHQKPVKAGVKPSITPTKTSSYLLPSDSLPDDFCNTFINHLPRWKNNDYLVWRWDWKVLYAQKAKRHGRPADLQHR